MPVDTVKLLDSDLNAIATPEEFRAAVRLWCKAWHQLPAASLPDDDRILATLSGSVSLGRWKRIREVALRGFVKCSDGRMYHPVIAAKAIEAWNHSKAQRERAHKRWDGHGDAGASATAMLRTRTETRTRTGQEKKPPKEPKPSAAARRPANGEAPTLDLWNAYAVAYHERYGVDPVRNAKVNGMMARFLERVPASEAPDIAAFYVRHSKGLYVSSRHCVDLLLRDAEGLRTEWATGRRVTDTEARQVDQTSARGEQVARLQGKVAP